MSVEIIETFKRHDSLKFLHIAHAIIVFLLFAGVKSYSFSFKILLCL